MTTHNKGLNYCPSIDALPLGRSLAGRPAEVLAPRTRHGADPVRCRPPLDGHVVQVDDVVLWAYTDELEERHG